MNKIDTIVIHSRKLAIYLQLKGFILLGVENDLKGKRKVFIFKNSEPLKQAMLQYKYDEKFHTYFAAEGR